MRRVCFTLKIESQRNCSGSFCSRKNFWVDRTITEHYANSCRVSGKNMKTIVHPSLSALPHGEDPPEPEVINPWLPGETLARRAVHELIFEPGSGHPAPSYVAMRVARHALADQPARGAWRAGQADAPAMVWCDPHHTVYPPALKLAGVPLDRLCLVHPPQCELLWTLAECLRCPGVGVVVATLPLRLSRVEARRLQLAAERGGGIAILMRPLHLAEVYAAASRWHVSPAPGERGIQRWKIVPFHGHGRYFGQSFTLENRRAFADCSTVEPVPLHPSAPLAHRAPTAPPARTSA